MHLFRKAAASRTYLKVIPTCLIVLILLPISRRRPLLGSSCCSQLLPNSKRRPLRGRSCDSQLSKKTHYFAAASHLPVVVVICCLQKGGRFAPVVVVPNCCQIQKGGRFATLVVNPNCPKETHYFASKKAAASFAPVVVVICSLQKGGRLR